MSKRPASKVQAAATTRGKRAGNSTAHAKKTTRPKSTTQSLFAHRFDARPDRLDFRDLTYEPPLRSLPAVFPTAEHLSQAVPSYVKANLVLDQGREGACTGFGLAAVVSVPGPAGCVPPSHRAPAGTVRWPDSRRARPLRTAPCCCRRRPCCHIKEIGFELYQSMLEEAILEAQASAKGVKPTAEGSSPQITAEVPILIPEDYAPDLNVRMALYRRLNEMQGRQDVDGFAAEMIDRFGPLPTEASNLLAIIEIKLACLAAGVAKLEAGPKGGLITFRHDKFANPEGLMAFLDRLAARAKIRPDQKVFIAADWTSNSARLKGALQLATTLAKLAAGATVKPAAPKAPPPAAKPLPPRPSVFRAKVKGR